MEQVYRFVQRWAGKRNCGFDVVARLVLVCGKCNLNSRVKIWSGPVIVVEQFLKALDTCKLVMLPFLLNLVIVLFTG